MIALSSGTTMALPMASKAGPPMKPASSRRLSVLLVFALLLCHGAFGALHLVCIPPECVADAGHAAEHQVAAGTVGDEHEHPAGHGTSTGYFAVLAGLLGLCLGLLTRVAPLRVGSGMPRTALLRRLPAAFHPPPTPTLPNLQVFRL